jgi:HNH endonuclease/NUMOD4 motif
MTTDKDYQEKDIRMERWLPVVGFEGLYEVSDQGRVRSLDRIVSVQGRQGLMSRRYRGRVLALGPHVGGYEVVHLYNGGRQRATVLHILVAEAFLGPRPPDAEVLHIDGNPKNCAVDNLRYGTKIENEAAR